jgi:hypothetical protein
VAFDFGKHFLLRRFRVEHLLKSIKFLFALIYLVAQALPNNYLRLDAIDDGVIDYFDADWVPDFVWDLRADPGNHIDCLVSFS